VQEAADMVLARAAAFTTVVNGRFKGGYVTRHYGDPGRGVHALQLEIAQACYMDENPPHPWNAGRAAPLVDVLSRLVAALLQWRRV
jgi:N-formylglutamate amidohydrolase